MENFQKYKRFIWMRAISELKADVRIMHMGLAWWVLDPLIYMGVFYVVFGIGLRQGGDGFVAFLLVGLVVWRWFDFSIKKSASSLMDYRGLISQIYIPKFILPLVSILANSLRFFIVYFILIFILIVMGDFHYQTLSWVPLFLVSQFVLIVGVGFLLAAIVPFVPDVKRVLDYAISLMFFMSGIFYKVDPSNEFIYSLFMLNPMAYFIECNRLILLHGLTPSFTYLLVHVSSSIIMFALALFLLKRFDKAYPLIIQ